MGSVPVSWAFARVGVHHLSLCLLYLGVFPLTLNFICVSSLQLMYLHPSVDPSLTHFLGVFPGLGLAMVPNVVVAEAEQRCVKQKSRFKFLPWPGFEPCSLMATNVHVWSAELSVLLRSELEHDSNIVSTF